MAPQGRQTLSKKSHPRPDAHGAPVVQQIWSIVPQVGLHEPFVQVLFVPHSLTRSSVMHSPLLHDLHVPQVSTTRSPLQEPLEVLQTETITVRRSFEHRRVDVSQPQHWLVGTHEPLPHVLPEHSQPATPATVRQTCWVGQEVGGPKSRHPDPCTTHS